MVKKKTGIIQKRDVNERREIRIGRRRRGKAKQAERKDEKTKRQGKRK